jgi:orotate phosphoribosyltransferase
MITPESIANLLLDAKAVALCVSPPFTWASGLKAPIYCDNRLLISFPEARQTIINGFKEIIIAKNLEFDVIGGTATAAIPWAAFLAYELKKPMVYIRPEPKGHGRGKQVEGTMEHGARVLIVEDLVSTGGSSLKSAAACEREYGATVTDVLAIFCYEMAIPQKAFAEKNLTLTTLSSFSALLQAAVARGYVSPAELENARQWRQDPEGWSARQTQN